MVVVSIDFSTSASSFLPSFLPRIGEIVGGEEDLPFCASCALSGSIWISSARRQGTLCCVCVCASKREREREREREEEEEQQRGRSKGSVNGQTGPCSLRTKKERVHPLSLSLSYFLALLCCCSLCASFFFISVHFILFFHCLGVWSYSGLCSAQRL